MQTKVPPLTGRRGAAILALAFVAILVASCSAIGGEETVIERRPALADAIANEAILGVTPLTTDPEAAVCIGRETYSQVGPSRLEELGVTVDDPSLGKGKGNVDPDIAAVIAECAARTPDTDEPEAAGTSESIELADVVEPPADEPPADEPSAASDVAAIGSSDEPAPNVDNDPGDVDDVSDAEPPPEEPDSGNAEAVASIVAGSQPLTTDSAVAGCIASRSETQLGRNAIGANGLPDISAGEAPTFITVLEECLSVDALFIARLGAAANPVHPDVGRCMVIDLGPDAVRSWLGQALVAGNFDVLGTLGWERIKARGFVSCV